MSEYNHEVTVCSILWLSLSPNLMLTLQRVRYRVIRPESTCREASASSRADAVDCRKSGFNGRVQAKKYYIRGSQWPVGDADGREVRPNSWPRSRCTRLPNELIPPSRSRRISKSEVRGRRHQKRLRVHRFSRLAGYGWVGGRNERNELIGRTCIVHKIDRSRRPSPFETPYFLSFDPTHHASPVSLPPLTPTHQLAMHHSTTHPDLTHTVESLPM